MKDTIKFLELFARMASNKEFERVLDMTPSDVAQRAKELDVVAPNDARTLARHLRKELADEELARSEELRKRDKLRVAEAVARKPATKPKRKAKKPNIDTIKKKYQKAQDRLDKQRNAVETPHEKWQAEDPDAFRREILYRGLKFVRMKYNITDTQILFEAKRLGLKLTWDTIRK